MRFRTKAFLLGNLFSVILTFLLAVIAFGVPSSRSVTFVLYVMFFLTAMQNYNLRLRADLRRRGKKRVFRLLLFKNIYVSIVLGGLLFISETLARYFGINRYVPLFAVFFIFSIMNSYNAALLDEEFFKGPQGDGE